MVKRTIGADRRFAFGRRIDLDGRAKCGVHFQSGTFLFTALMTATIDVPAAPIPENGKKGWRRYLDEIRVGLDYARRDVFVSRLIFVQMLASLAVGGTSVLMVVLSEQHLRLAPAGFSTLLLAIGVGALLGPFLLGLVTQNYQNLRLLFVPYVIRGGWRMPRASASSIISAAR